MAITLAITALTIGALVVELTSPEVVLMAAVTLLLVTGVLTPEAAVAGFGAVTVLTIAALFIIGEGIRRTGVLGRIGDVVMGRSASRLSLARLITPSAALSSVLGNTLIVAMLVPVVIDWSKRTELPSSRLLMPLSFATILGGTCTLIGTSTNLVIDGFMTDVGLPRLGMFELAWVGVPITVVGLGYLALAAGRLLPTRRDPVAALAAEKRQFFVELQVEAKGRLVGKLITEHGLDELPGVHLVHAERGGLRLDLDDPDQRLRAGDRLALVATAAAVVSLRGFAGLAPAPEAHFDPLDVARRDSLFEAVVSVASPLVGTTIQDLGFRRRYDAAVIAIHRAGRELVDKIGATELRPGDTLMIEADREFGDRWGNRGDFALVSRLRAEPRPMRGKAPHALIILAAMVVAISAEWVSVLTAAFAAVGLMLAARILTPTEARRSVRLSILITIAGALALGRALEDTGAAPRLAGWIVDIAGDIGPHGLLGVTLVLAVMLSSVVTNAAAAAMAFPIITDAARLAGHDPRPFAIALAIGCSASFLTPFGYQTNLMVYGPGGYRFVDFVRLGLPLTILVCASAMVVIPWAWPFSG